MDQHGVCVRVCMCGYYILMYVTVIKEENIMNLRGEKGTNKELGRGMEMM